jgi:integrase
MGVKVREKPTGSGVYWVFINHEGKRKSKKIGKLETADKVAELIDAKLKLGQFEFDDKKTAGETFKKVANLWITLPHDWKETTRESYMASLESHVHPALGKRPISEITRKELKLFFDKLYSDGLSMPTITTIRAPLSGIFGYAIESEIIEANPVRDLVLKYKKKKFEIEPLDENEAVAVLDQSKLFVGGKYYPAVLTSLRTGIRIGELQALKWDCIDFENRTMEIKRSWRKNRTTRTKNKKRRKVDMTPLLTEVLLEHRTQQKKAALKAGRPFSNHVFTGDRQEIMGRVAFQNALNRCCKKAGLRHIRTHDLRHSYATIRLMRGHNIGDVSYQLGHSSISMTLDVYSHWMPGGFKSEVDDLDNPKKDTLQNAELGADRVQNPAEK